MPIPTHTGPEPSVFPSLTIAQIDAARTSAWYHIFEDLTIPSIIINLKELGEKDLFLQWLDSESIFIPTETYPETEHGEQSETSTPRYHLPKLSRKIRESIFELGGTVFPKLNWTAPQDAAFLLPQTNGPLSCSSAYDIYLLLKSSDFVSHSIDPERAYEGTIPPYDEGGMELELVLKRYEALNPAREFRCFVRDDILLGASVRDYNFYPHFQDPSTIEKVQNCIRTFYEDEILGDYPGGKDYIFDIVLNDSNTSCRLIDFNPYYPSSDPLLFTYEELHQILLKARTPPAPIGSGSNSTGEGSRLGRLPIIKVIDSASHPGANRGMPAFGTNMLPVEIVEMSQGRGVGEFKAAWDEVVRDGLEGESDSEEEEDKA